MGGDPSDAKKLEWDGDDPDEDEASSGSVPRETVRPSFDIERYAAATVTRERMATITDEAATEEARIASVLMDSSPPGARASTPDVIVGVQYAEVEALGPDEQLAFLRARLAPMSRVPMLARKLAELGPDIEDPKTAYVLGFVDGLLPLETIVEVAGVPELDALRVLERAVDLHLVTFPASDAEARR